MQCILTVAVATVVTASHTDLQAKSSPLALLFLLFPPCPPFILAITTFFPWPTRSHHRRWVSFYEHHFIYHTHLAKTSKCHFRTKKIVVNRSFSSCPWEHCLPLSALLLSAGLLPVSPPCRGTARAASRLLPHPGMLPPGPPAPHCPANAQAPWGSPWPPPICDQADHSKLTVWKGTVLGPCTGN